MRKRLRKERELNNARYRNNYRSYAQYLKSPHWELKKKTFKKTVCELCLSPVNLNLHHINYDGITDEQEWELMTLCKLCHKAAHVGILGIGKTRNPSRSITGIICRLRNGDKPKKESWALFLRRRYGITHNLKTHPDFKYFRHQAVKEMWRVHSYWNDGGSSLARGTGASRPTDRPTNI